MDIADNIMNTTVSNIERRYIELAERLCDGQLSYSLTMAYQNTEFVHEDGVNCRIVTYRSNVPVIKIGKVNKYLEATFKVKPMEILVRISIASNVSASTLLSTAKIYVGDTVQKLEAVASRAIAKLAKQRNLVHQ